MRRCGNCRSLLLGDVESCPRCSGPLPVAVGVAAAPAPSAPATPSWPPAPAPSAASAPAGIPPQAPSYGRLSIPPPVPPVQLGAPPAPATAPAPPTVSPLPAYDAWQQQVAVAPPTKTAPLHNPWARVALAVVVVLIVGAAVMHLRSDPLPAGTSAFVAGKGVTYTSPDGAFVVQFPQQPQVLQQTFTLNGVNAPLLIAATQTTAYVIEVASVVSPVPFGSRVDDALKQMAAQRLKSTHGIGVRQVTSMHGSQPALDARFKVNGHIAHMLVVATDSSVIMLMVYAKTGTDRLFKALNNSFVIR